MKVVSVYTEETANPEADTVYFSGLMMVKSNDVTAGLLGDADMESVHMADFIVRAIDAGLTLGVIISSREAVVDINSLNDLMKAGEIE